MSTEEKFPSTFLLMASKYGNMQFYFLFSKRILWNEDNMTVMIVIKLMTIF